MNPRTKTTFFVGTRVPLTRLLSLCTAVVFNTVCMADAKAQTFTVDCTRGDSIGSALAKGDARKPIVLNIKGECHEVVSINRDDVTLQGAPRATIDPQDNTVRAIDVLGSDVHLKNLDVIGGNLGIAFNGTARAVATNCTVRDTKSDGIRLFAGDARLQGIHVENAGGHGISLQRRSSLAISGNSEISHNQMNGIYATLNSALSMSGGAIHDNEGHGVALENGAEASFSGTAIEENEQAGISASQAHAFLGQGLVSENHGAGIQVLAGANAAVDGNTITGNRGHGVLGYLGATIVMHGNNISGNGLAGVSCDSHCTLQIGDNAAISYNGNDGIALVRGSVLILEETGVFSDNNGGWGLWCGDAQASVSGLGNLTADSVSGCSEFSY